MRRLLPVALAAAAASAGVAIAATSPVKPGQFKGKTVRKNPMGLRVDKAGQVRNLYFEGIRLRCTDGFTFKTATGKKRWHGDASPVFEDGQWQLNNDGFKPYGVYVYGQFSADGKKTTGSIHVITSTDKHHKLKNGLKGTNQCSTKTSDSSGYVKFTLKRVK